MLSQFYTDSLLKQDAEYLLGYIPVQPHEAVSRVTTFADYDLLKMFEFETTRYQQEIEDARRQKIRNYDARS